MLRREKYASIFRLYDSEGHGLTEKQLITGEKKVFGYTSTKLRKELLQKGTVYFINGKYYCNNGEPCQFEHVPMATEVNASRENTVIPLTFPIYGKIVDTLFAKQPDWVERFGDISIRNLPDKDFHHLTNHNRVVNHSYSLEEHVRGVVYAMLSSMRKWGPIGRNIANIDRIFCNFNLSQLKRKSPSDIVKEIKIIKCGNAAIGKQMESLHNNISVLEKIEADNGRIDTYYDSIMTRPNGVYELVKALSSGALKLNEMGIALICEYLKNVGIDIAKPDRHICRILIRMGYLNNQKFSDNLKLNAIKVCYDIARAYNMLAIEVDRALWWYCAEDGLHACNAKCHECFGNTICPKVDSII